MALLEIIAPKVEQKREPLQGAFFWLSAFYVVYCARPEDWIPGLKYLPLAKITSVCALMALLLSIGRAKRSFRNLPREGCYLIALVCFLVLTSFFSPVWKGGAFANSLDFAKVAVAWVLTFLVITNFKRLRQIIFIQTASVAVIAIISVVKGRNAPRLEGVLGGIYDNSNDLAFAIVLCLPFCLAFLLQGRGPVRILMWLLAMLIMAMALFLTASRSGFIELTMTAFVCLWHFGVKGKRPLLIAATFAVGGVLLLGVGGKLKNRFFAISGESNSQLEQTAYGSYQERRQLMITSIQAMARYPIFGIGIHNFVTYSGIWKEVHNSFLQIGAEGGIPGLVLYLLVFRCAFANLRRLRRLDLDVEIRLFVVALHSSLVGFITGAFFAPEAYHYFPYFAVAETSVIWAMVREKDPEIVFPAMPRTLFTFRHSTEPFAVAMPLRRPHHQNGFSRIEILPRAKSLQRLWRV
jgi:O-antigen ligase